MTDPTPFQVLITDRFSLDAMARLQGEARLKVTRANAPQPSAVELAEAEGMIIRSRTKVDRELLAQAPKLKVVITSTSGFDHIDLDAAAEYGVRVMYTPDANAASAAELTWALVLACQRKLVDAHRAVKSGEWRREALMGSELQGKTYGIVGLGRIGSRVARIARAFEMKVIAFDPYKENEHFDALGAQRMGLEELLKLADVMSVHVPATPETNGLLTRNLLDCAHRGLLLINTSRGSVVSEQDLVEALTLGWIAGCGLDVFEKEPLPRYSGLLGLANVVMTPHIGATTHEAFAKASLEASEKLIAFALHGRSSDCLPPDDPWWMAGFSKGSLRQRSESL